MSGTLHQPKFISAALRVIHKKQHTGERLNLKHILKILKNLNFNTIRFNFAYFDFKTAIRFPVFVKRNVRLNKLKGNIRIDGSIQPGMILIGHGFVGHFDCKSTTSIWDVDEAQIVFKGTALIKKGAKIIVGKNAYLELGDNFRISCNSCLICYKRIVFGDNCRLSWEVQVMDTDFHKIKSLTGEHLNPDKDIVIGNHVWIGTKATIMKGSKIYEDCIVASNSVVTKEIAGNHQIIAGTPAKVVKTGITWDK